MKHTSLLLIAVSLCLPTFSCSSGSGASASRKLTSILAISASTNSMTVAAAGDSLPPGLAIVSRNYRNLSAGHLVPYFVTVIGGTPTAVRAAAMASCLPISGQNSMPRPTQDKIPAARASADIDISFELHPKFAAILLHVEVNKQPAVMILDTGSSRTILDPRIVDVDSREPRRPASVGMGSGISGNDARWGKATLQVGTHLFRDWPVVVSDMRDVSHNFQQPIDGLLGQDIVSKFHIIVIDFDSRKITLGASSPR